MSAGDSLGPQFVEHRYTPKGEGENPMAHQIDAYKGDEHVGFMQWYDLRNGKYQGDRHGQVAQIGVYPPHQRQGIASGMWAAARAYADLHEDIPEPKHSTNRTFAGQQWAKKVSPPHAIPENLGDW